MTASLTVDELMSRISPYLSSEPMETRRQRVRDLWEYRPIDHIPVYIFVASNPWGYSYQEQLRGNHDKQLAVNLAGVWRTLSDIPDDYIPVLQPSVASDYEIPTALGAKLWWGDNPEQGPAVRDPLVRTTVDIGKLHLVDPYSDGLLPLYLERIAYFREKTGGQIPIAVDLRGPCSTALAICDPIYFFKAMVKEPQAIANLYEVVTDSILAFGDACIKVAGGLETVAATGFDLIWQPEGCKGYVADDVAATVSPEQFRMLDMPSNNRFFTRYGGGLMHC
jgi:hypothetical protein